MSIETDAQATRTAEYLQRAVDARRMAETTLNPEIKLTLEKLATDCEQMADYARKSGA